MELKSVYTLTRKKTEMVKLPSEIIILVCDHLSTIDDVINYSMVDKWHYESINKMPNLWIKYLKRINVWGKGSGSESESEFKSNAECKLTPVNCLSYKINDPNLARDRFLEIWKLLTPIVNELLIKDYNNFQSLSTFQKYNDPLSQANILANLNQIVVLYRNLSEYKTMVVKLDTLINLFINSIINEIGVRLDVQDYEIVKTLINSLDKLSLNSDQIDPLESLIEFFYERYNEDCNFLLTSDQIDQFFIKENSNKRGVVNGIEFSFENTDLFFDKLAIILNKHLMEINNIFHCNNASNQNDMDEVPIVLKLLEHFLSNYLVGVLIDRLISRSKEIDSMEENLLNSNSNLNLNLNGTSEGGNEKEGEEEEEDSNKINIMNENSLFFQCVPFIYFKLISMIQNIKYPETELLLDNGNKSKMDYIKVGCQLVNYCYESYLIDFANELPLRCKASLFQLIDAWQSENANIQRNIEHEIMKNVEDDLQDDSKFNFEIFSTFSNMFSFKKQKNELEEDNGEKEVKISKIAAKLKILTNKVETLKSLVSIDLVVLLLQHIKNSYDLLLGLTNYSITEQLSKQINQTCINIFNDMLNILIHKHIKQGFNEALNRLKNYDPMIAKGVLGGGGGEHQHQHQKQNHEIFTLDPLKNFIQLVDVGDLILQMVEIFYDKELINCGIIGIKNQHSRDFLKMNVIEKSIKLLESSLDNYVATGLDISIKIIINEIQNKIEQVIGPIPQSNTTKPKNKLRGNSKNGNVNNTPEVIYGAQFPPPSSSQTMTSMMSSNSNISSINTDNRVKSENKVYDIKEIEQLPMNQGLSMEWVRLVFDVMDTHFNLLQGSIEKGIMDVFKQEIGDRFITLLVQLIMKKFIISTIGAIQFSFDINSIYNFYQRHKIKPAIEYLIGFKKIDQIYLVECNGDKAKIFELGKMIIDIGRDNGIFTPEEVYQYSTRRSDWPSVKRNVDKVVYGFGVDDCVLM